eukprot:1393563-Amorphochlora_amoeboformis.AAC.3
MVIEFQSNLDYLWSVVVSVCMVIEFQSKLDNLWSVVVSVCMVIEFQRKLDFLSSLTLKLGLPPEAHIQTCGFRWHHDGAQKSVSLSVTRCGKVKFLFYFCA